MEMTTLEVLKEYTNTCYIVNPRGASLESSKIAGYDINQKGDLCILGILEALYAFIYKKSRMNGFKTM